MKNLFLLLLVAAVLLSGCSWIRSVVNDNDDQLAFGKGVVVSPLSKINGEWIFTVETSYDGSEVQLVCPPGKILKKCGNIRLFDMATYTSKPANTATKLRLTRLSLDSK